MKNKKVLRDERGVSYVMAVFLVAVVTLALATMLYGWAGGFIGSVSPVPSETREEIAIEAGILNLADVGNDGVYDIRYWHYCTANTGPVDVEVEAMYIMDSDGNVIYHLSTTELKEAGYAIYRVNTGDFNVSTGEPKDNAAVDFIMYGPLEIPAGNSRCFEGSVAINIKDLGIPEDQLETAVVRYDANNDRFYWDKNNDGAFDPTNETATDDFEFFHGEGGAQFKPGEIYIVKLTTVNGATASIAVKAAKAEA